MGFLAKIKNIIRFARVTGPADNSAQVPVQQMSYKGKVADVLQVFPYGLYANVSSNDSLGILFSIDGSENNKAALSYTPQKRPTDLKQNEIAIYHPYTRSFIKFRNNGNIEIDSTQDTPGDIIINTVNAQVNASGSISLDAPTVNVTGDLNVGADLDVTGATRLSTSVTSAGKNIGATHTHTGGTLGGGLTGAPV